MTSRDFAVVDVDCYAGYRGEETPRRFRLGGRQFEIAELIDRWLAPDHRCFKVRDENGDIYTLRHDVAHDSWELTPFPAVNEILPTQAGTRRDR